MLAPLRKMVYWAWNLEGPFSIAEQGIQPNQIVAEKWKIGTRGYINIWPVLGRFSYFSFISTFIENTFEFFFWLVVLNVGKELIPVIGLRYKTVM